MVIQTKKAVCMAIFYFTDQLEGLIIEEIQAQDVANGKYTYASYSYYPCKKTYSTVFIAKGNGNTKECKNRIDVSW